MTSVTAGCQTQAVKRTRKVSITVTRRVILAAVPAKAEPPAGGSRVVPANPKKPPQAMLESKP